MRHAPFLRLLQILGVNAVPAAGYFGAGWSPGTTLLLYWLESIAMVLLISGRIILHRRATRKRGHYRTSRVSGKRGGKGTLLQSFTAIAVPFNLAHGVFLAAILFLMLPQMMGSDAVRVDLIDLKTGSLGMLAFLCIGFLIDWFNIGKLPFRWIERLVERSLRRVVVVHLSIIFGMVAMAFWEAPRTFFAVFIVLKMLTDLSWLLPQGEDSPEPPRWVLWIAPRGKDRSGETIAEYWRRTHAAEQQIRRENEEVVAPGRH